FFQAEDGIRDFHVTGVQTCALPILRSAEGSSPRQSTAVVRDGQGSTRAERARGRTARRRPVGKGARAAQRHSGNVRRAGYEKFSLSVPDRDTRARHPPARDRPEPRAQPNLPAKTRSWLFASRMARVVL